MSKTIHSFVQYNLQSDKKIYKAELVVLTSSFFFLQEAVLNPPYGKFNLTLVAQQYALVNLQLTFVIRSTEGRRLLSLPGESPNHHHGNFTEQQKEFPNSHLFSC